MTLHVWTIITVLRTMIRTNKLTKQKQNKYNATKIQTYNYRNALYQGEVSMDKHQREGKGIIYIPDNHHFIVCNSFNNNQLNSHTLFFHSHSKYQYGQWKKNQPEGVTIFRMNQVLIIAEYCQGTLQTHSKVLLIFQQYNTGIILQVLEDNKWEIIQKEEVLCSQHLQDLIKMCNFSKQSIPSLLVKYLNNYMVSDQKKIIKLRLINNIYYRLGYDQGLAIIFDDQYKILSVGVHNKSELTSYGVKYNNQKLGNKVEEGIFDGHGTFIFDQPNRPLQRIGQLYCKSHLSSVNFKNEVYKDPSQPYFKQFQEILQSEPIVELFANIIHNPTDFQSFRKIMAEEPKKEESFKKYEKLEFPQYQITTFKKTQQLQEPQYQQEIRQEEASSVIWQNSHRSVETFEFERLSEKNRLDILKKQLYINLSHKSIKQQERERKSKIINMSPVSVLNVDKSKKSQIKIEETPKPNQVYIYEPQRIAKQILNSNLDKHIDIKINDFPEKEQPKEVKPGLSKSRKRIFEQCPNVIKDYSPQTSPTLSPFKSKIRSKIFNKTPDRNDKSRSRSSRKIFQNIKTPQKIDVNQMKTIHSNEPQSPHMMYEASLQKSESSSHIKPYPITMSQEGKEKSKNKISKEAKQNDQNIREIAEEKIKWNNYLETKSKPEVKEPDEEYRRKSNTVYRNPMKSEYGDYVFEPIDIKQTGNKPYLKSNQTSSNKVLVKDTSKKSIEETNLFKREKMSAYMDSTPYGYRGSERFADFKRRVNYF